MQRPPVSLPRVYRARISLSKLMKSELAAGKTLASPRLLRYVSYSVCVKNTRIVGRSPSSGRCPRSWDLAATVPAALAAPPKIAIAATTRPKTAIALPIGSAGYSATRSEALPGPLHIAVRHALLRIAAVALASGVSAIALLGVGRLVLIGDLGIALPPLTAIGTSVITSPNPAAQAAVLSDLAAP